MMRDEAAKSFKQPNIHIIQVLAIQNVINLNETTSFRENSLQTEVQKGGILFKYLQFVYQQLDKNVGN